MRYWIIFLLPQILFWGCDKFGDVTYKGELAKPKAIIVFKDILKYQKLIICNKSIDKNNNELPEYADFDDFSMLSDCYSIPKYLFDNRSSKYSISNNDYIFTMLFPGENLPNSRITQSRENPREKEWFCLAWPADSRPNLLAYLLDSNGVLHTIDPKIVNLRLSSFLSKSSDEILINVLQSDKLIK